MISSPSSPHAESVQKFALEINSVHKSFGQVDVLKGVDLKLDIGERVALMGPSGSGKSTLLNCICGIESMDQGEIKLGGLSLNDMSLKKLEQIRRQAIGYVLQGPKKSTKKGLSLFTERSIKLIASVVKSSDKDKLIQRKAQSLFSPLPSNNLT